ncbi:MAG: hypothetical protein MSC31_14190 [Solirubrobacteraceae bacterium MAG38_C4-C5]|nr:hypothetical protein [Candidatus Siliceabacter maunaloa]
MADKLKGILIAMAAVAVLAIGGVAIAMATSGDEPAQPAGVAAQETENESDENESGENEADEQASGPRADAAARAAREAVGGGKVLEVENADEGKRGFEVEIERPDGSYVEVNLDKDLRVVATGSDD